MRDHTRLRAFELTDQLVLSVYQITQRFPKDEQFGLIPQIRRAAVSAASNIVEGCARQTKSQYVHFLSMAFGSVREVEYQLSLAHRLGYISPVDYEPLRARCLETSKVLGALIRSLRDTRPEASAARRLGP